MAIRAGLVAALMPCCRHKVPVLAPASLCFTTPMICSSLNLLFFTVRFSSAMSAALET
jgi:hypothetical protein